MSHKEAYELGLISKRQYDTLVELKEISPKLYALKEREWGADRASVDNYKAFHSKAAVVFGKRKDGRVYVKGLLVAEGGCPVVRRN